MIDIRIIFLVFLLISIHFCPVVPVPHVTSRGARLTFSLGSCAVNVCTVKYMKSSLPSHTCKQLIISVIQSFIHSSVHSAQRIWKLQLEAHLIDQGRVGNVGLVIKTSNNVQTSLGPLHPVTVAGKPRQKRLHNVLDAIHVVQVPERQRFNGCMQKLPELQI